MLEIMIIGIAFAVLAIILFVIDMFITTKQGASNKTQRIELGITMCSVLSFFLLLVDIAYFIVHLIIS